jgi:hypothetical protein
MDPVHILIDLLASTSKAEVKLWLWKKSLTLSVSV